MLYLAINYLPGWKAYIDGNETDVHIANGRYIGLDIPMGKHKVEIRYSRENWHVYVIMTLMGSILFGLLIAIENRRLKYVQ